MSEKYGGAMAAKRLMGVLGTAALTVGMLTLAPAAADADDPTQSISGTIKGVGFKAGKNRGSISVYRMKDGNCLWVNADVTWDGNKYTAKVPTARNYRVLYSHWDSLSFTKAHRYGVAEAWYSGAVTCEGSKYVTVAAGQNVVKKHIAVKGNGKIQVKSQKLAHTKSVDDYVTFFDAKTNREVTAPSALDGTTTTAVVNPGLYRVAIVRTTTKNGHTSQKVLKVHGTTSKKVKKGAAVRVSPNEATLVTFGVRAKKVKDFSYKTMVKITGTPAAGSTLKAKRSALPKGTTVKYQWWSSYGKLKGATKSTYKVKTTDRGAAIFVNVTASKPGYVKADFDSAMKYVPGKHLRVATAQTLAVSGTKMKVTKATFQVPVSATITWYVNDVWDGGGTKTYDISSLTAGDVVKAEVYYWKKGYEAVTKTTTAVVP